MDMLNQPAEKRTEHKGTNDNTGTSPKTPTGR